MKGEDVDLTLRHVQTIAVLVLLNLLPLTTCAQDDFHIWREFVRVLRSGEMTMDRIRPLEQLGDKYKQILLGYLDSVRTQASPEDWEAIPEVIRTDSRFQYIVPWSTRYEKINYCFSFITEGPQWYFQHLESIFIRLDTVSTFPATTFPDVSERQKAWAREEIYWSFVVLNVYLPTAQEKGKETALNLLRDGGGYFVGAKTWVPFAPPHKVFILYLCWEQANLRGNSVELKMLTDDEAVVHVQPQFLALYDVAAHLKPKISLDDYRRIFETIWQDRATSARWKLEIEFLKDYVVELRFTRTI